VLRQSLTLKLAVCCLPAFLAAQSTQQLLSTRAANRILEQGTWGPTPADMRSLETQGFDAWFAAQLSAPASTFPDQPAIDPTTGKTNFNLSPLQLVFFQNALSAPDQLRQRVAFALSEIWVVSEFDVNNASAFAPLLNLFSSDAFGNYETLMKDVTLSPAMGRYLNMVNNDKANPATNTAANENYGRELMQLFTIGLTQLNMDGSAVVDANGDPVPTYTPADVTSMSRALTGWTYPPMPGHVTKGHNPAYFLDPMVAIEGNHDTGSKTLFVNNAIPAGQTAEQDVDSALHILFLQPSLPPFISKQLIQHLVTSNPSPAYIQRVASVFADNGSGVRGDLKSVIYAILTDPEARTGDDPSLPDNPAFGHLREPVLLNANLLRALGGKLSNSSKVSTYATNLGQQLFYAPSVFSYFSPLYRNSSGLLAPEFQLYSTQTAPTTADNISSILYNGHLDSGTTFNLSAYITAASQNDSFIGLINDMFFHDSMSSGLVDNINGALAPLTAPADKAKAALYVALTSSEYLVMH
jgi:uncharacterized protein (DUF1800 family)